MKLNYVLFRSHIPTLHFLQHIYLTPPQAQINHASQPPPPPSNVHIFLPNPSHKEAPLANSLWVYCATSPSLWELSSRPDKGSAEKSYPDAWTELPSCIDKVIQLHEQNYPAAWAKLPSYMDKVNPGVTQVHGLLHQAAPPEPALLHTCYISGARHAAQGLAYACQRTTGLSISLLHRICVYLTAPSQIPMRTPQPLPTRLYTGPR